MALEKTIQHTPDGFDTPSILKNSYIRVDAVSGTRKNLCVTVGFYNNKNNQMKMARSEAHQFQPSVETDAKNFIAQAYEHLKTLPEFAGAIDC